MWLPAALSQTRTTIDHKIKRKKIMEIKIETKTKPEVSEIRLRAYQLWEKSHHESGRDQEHWLQAEAALVAAWRASLKTVEAVPVANVSAAKPERGAQPQPMNSGTERRNPRSRRP